MIKFKKIKLFSRGNICYCDVLDGKNNFEIILHFDIVLKYTLKNGLEVDNETYQSIIYDNSLLKAKNLSYTFASYKMRTQYEVEKRLKQNSYDDKIIAECISFLYEFKLLDNENYANLFVKEKSLSKNWGKIRIKNELLNKGVNENIILNAIDNFFPNDESFEKAIKIAKKKYDTLLKRHDDKKSKQLLFAFLARRGFETSKIKEIIENI
jgi:regulatory protein